MSRIFCTKRQVFWKMVLPEAKMTTHEEWRCSKVFAGRRRFFRLATYERARRALRRECELAHLRCKCQVKSAHRATKMTTHKEWSFLLAGVARFELANRGVKVLCLTAWRYPFLVVRQLVYHNFWQLSI